MSELAEFAQRIHKSYRVKNERPLEAVDYPLKTQRLYGVRAVICDVYGTLVNYWSDDFSHPQRKDAALLKAFRKVADYFGMEPSLKAINPSDAPEKTLYDFYNGLITLKRERERKKCDFPEIRIEEIWEVIITLLRRHGYTPPAGNEENRRDFSRKIAWFYNFHALGRQLYPGVVETLVQLKKKNIVAGLLSNAQFYTPIDLTLMIRDQRGGTIDDFVELFDSDLTFFSYEYQVAKPNPLLFRRLYDALYEYRILPDQSVFIGNDLSIDIAPAQEAGMKTAFFTGDRHSAYFHDLAGKVIPDITFSHWTDLIERLSFHTEDQK
ncbi:MAG: HAD family hydrolase [Chitinispirillaceae bacterium]|nr:HAD family hydrolase [Chitinispirillaceae bacterium]